MHNAHRNPPQQKGYVTLTIALIILFLITLVTFLSARIGTMEQRTAANEFLSKQAFQTAEGGVEQGIAFLNNNRKNITSTKTGGWLEPGNVKWAVCTPSEMACGNEYDSRWLYYSLVKDDLPINLLQPTDTVLPSRHVVHFLVRCNDPDNATSPHCQVSNGPDKSSPIIIRSEGFTDLQDKTKVSEWRTDALGKSTIQEVVFFSPVFNGSVPAPIISAATVPSLGNMHVVANPNAGGVSFPLSVWSSEPVAIGGSAVTCHVEEFLNNTTKPKIGEDWVEETDNNGVAIIKCPSCQCPSTSLTGTLAKSTNPDSKDITDEDPNFPDDLFEYIFGVKRAKYDDVKSIAENMSPSQVLESCETLNTASSGLYWVTSNCKIGTSIGSFAEPILLVVQGELQIVAGSNEIFGLVFAIDPTKSPGDTPSLEAKISGGPTLYGALVVDNGVHISGTIRVRYSEDVLNNLDNLSSSALANLAGGWRDF